MSALEIDNKLKKVARYLASQTNYPLGEEDHNAAAYEGMLKYMVKNHIEGENTQEFKNLGRYLCFNLLGLSGAIARKQIAVTALQIIHLRSLKVAVVEDMADMSGGDLAKLKSGQPQQLTPIQIIYLAVELDVPISLLNTDFSDNPEGLTEKLFQSEEVEEIQSEADCMEAAEVESEAPDDTEVLSAAERTTKVVSVTNDETEAEEETGAEPEAATEVEVAEEIVDTAAEEVVWLDDLTLKIGGQKYDLTSAELRTSLARHMRALTKTRNTSFAEVLKKGKFGKRTTSWLSGLENGKSRIYKEELEQFSDLLDTTLHVLLTGFGLDPTLMVGRGVVKNQSGALVPIGSPTLVLPAISEENRNEYFRGRCLKKGVEAASDRDISELLELAGSDEPVDWYAAWRDITSEGATFFNNMQIFTQKFAKPGLNDVIKSMVLTELHALMWPINDEV